MVAVFGIGNRDFFCKQCGFAVCAQCSTNKKFLSKDGKEKFRVCDLCDTKLDNVRLRLNYERLLALKEEKIKLSEQLFQKLKEQKAALEAEQVAEKLVQKQQLDQINQSIETEIKNAKQFDNIITQLKVEITFQQAK